MTNEVREIFEFMASGGRSVLNNYGSRAASSPKEDRMITEVINGIITSRPAKKITYLNESKTEESESEPEIIELGGKSKASVPSINKLKEIHDFINRRY